MLEQKHRKQIVIAFIVGILFIIFSMGAFWSAYIDENRDGIGFLTVFFSIIGFTSLTILFRLAFRISDYETYTENINDLITKERVKVLEEIQAKEKEKDQEDNQEDDLADIVKEIIPAGNFKNIENFGKKVLVNLSNALNFFQGVLYVASPDGKKFSFATGYALTDEQEPQPFELGENLTGEAAESKELMIVDEIPESYFLVESGLGSAKPGYLIILPIVSKDKTIAILELASFSSLTDKEKQILEEVSELLEPKLNLLVKA